MTIPYRPTPRRGLYEDPLWQFVALHELRLQRCTQCAQLRYPPGPICPRCNASGFFWSRLSGRGRVLSWTVFHRQYFPALPPPYTVVSVETEEGPLLIGNLVEPGSRQIVHGMPVHAVFEDVPSPTGVWTICQWARDS